MLTETTPILAAATNESLLMCGKPPHLSPCTAAHPAIGFMSDCAPMTTVVMAAVRWCGEPQPPAPFGVTVIPPSDAAAALLGVVVTVATLAVAVLCRPRKRTAWQQKDAVRAAHADEAGPACCPADVGYDMAPNDAATAAAASAGGRPTACLGLADTPSA